MALFELKDAALLHQFLRDSDIYTNVVKLETAGDATSKSRDATERKNEAETQKLSVALEESLNLERIKLLFKQQRETGGAG